jgi:hypothetical protein
MIRYFTKSEVLITQFAEQIGTKFKRLYLRFQGHPNELEFTDELEFIGLGDLGPTPADIVRLPS